MKNHLVLNLIIFLYIQFITLPTPVGTISDNRIISDSDSRTISDANNRIIPNDDTNRGITKDITTDYNDNRTTNNNSGVTLIDSTVPRNTNKSNVPPKRNVLPVPSTPRNKSKTFTQKNASIPTRKSNRSTTWKAGPFKLRQISNKKSSEFSCDVRTVYKIKKKNRYADNLTYDKAFKSENAKEWLAAVQEEMDRTNFEEVFTYLSNEEVFV